jgi:glycine hydroxymethyltransferase
MNKNMKDKKIEKLIKLEIKRQKDTLDLIASENMVSGDVLEALGSVFTNKYSEGYPGKRYYPGNKYCDEVENIAKERALRLFGLSKEKWSVNVQPYSGSPGNLAVYNALLEPGEKIMGLKLAEGGHLTHGHKVSATAKFWKSVQYGLNQKTGLIDFVGLEKLAKKEKPKVIISGFTAYPREVNFRRFEQIAKRVGAYHVADISHISGLVASGVHMSPFPYSDVVMTTTHKTLRGPRGAIIFSRKELSEKIDKSVFPGLQGGPHDNVTAAKAIAFFEAMQPEFKKYAKQIVKNAKALSDALLKLGFVLVSGGTDTHLILVDVKNFNIDGKEAEERLEKAGIVANRNSVPGDISPFKPSGLRIGTPSLTTRGMKEKEMKYVAQLIYDAIQNKPGTQKNVLKLCKKFPAKGYL